MMLLEKAVCLSLSLSRSGIENFKNTPGNDESLFDMIVKNSKLMKYQSNEVTLIVTLYSDQ